MILLQAGFDQIHVINNFSDISRGPYPCSIDTDVSPSRVHEVALKAFVIIYFIFGIKD